MNGFIKTLVRTSVSTDTPFRDGLDWWLFGLTLLIGAGFTLYIDHLGLLLYLVDQYSHLSIARQITDSLTPGMSQVGFWPPLLHVLMAPFAAFDALFFTGYAAPLLLVPVLGLGVVLMARTIYLLTDHRLISYLFAPLFLINPYLWYFAVTPMMEVLFLTMLIGTAYYFAHWWLTNRISSLVLSGVFVAMASVSRFEGFVLLPLLGGLLVLKLMREQRPLPQIEAGALLFGLIASTGIIFTLVYGYIYNDDPMAFASNSWGAYAQQRDLDLPGEGSVVHAVHYLGAAAGEMLGTVPLAIFLIGSILLLLTLRHHRWIAGSVLLILVSPFIFDILAVVQGSAIIYLPYLPPYPATYFNVRYGLLLAAAVVVVPALLAALLTRVFYTTRWSLPTHLLPAFHVFAFMLVSTTLFAHSTGCSTCLDPIRLSRQTSPLDHAPAAAMLAEQYDGGYILMTRALHNEVAVKAGIPLRHYILEANEHYYDQALETPWLFARYVVMFQPNDQIHQQWQRQNERVSLLWANNADFNYFYQTLFTSDGVAVYQLDEARLRHYVRSRGFPEAEIPALSTSVDSWEVGEPTEAVTRALEEWRVYRTAATRIPEKVTVGGP